ncbi:hypothetical protein PI124_g12530 [Phytophthora idaei]|nr:hypothetical protein PI125_g25369 [Phytophthora idaei]KAG3124335.1 hypothetical protein PI126_g23295 [Phytophthora idaei]KAG3242636.1 hypothetical protein PI124_g12530 [Phytophthora idaei]
MLNIFCAIVNVGSAFEVKIDGDESVSTLKEAIKKNIQDEADDLQLFLAKKDGDACLSLTDPLVRQLREGGPGSKGVYINEELNDPTDQMKTISPSEIPQGGDSRAGGPEG